VDGAGWRGVYDILKKDSFNVSVVQNPTISLTGDVAATKMVIHSQPNPVILVGHSYGGVVITEAGTDPNVAGLVYITAFAPDAGESVNTLIANPPPGAPVPPILPPQDGYLFLDKAKFVASFAGDVDPQTAAFMADSQVPWGVDALGGASLGHAVICGGVPRDTSDGVSRLGHAARPGDAAFNDASAIDCAASLARARLTMSLTLPFGIRTRHMPSQSGSGTTIASGRPERMRRRLPSHRRSCRSYIERPSLRWARIALGASSVRVWEGAATVGAVLIPAHPVQAVA
jgi:pimeloyl-ACP methyl ester carboxylesterase